MISPICTWAGLYIPIADSDDDEIQLTTSDMVLPLLHSPHTVCACQAEHSTMQQFRHHHRTLMNCVRSGAQSGSPGCTEKHTVGNIIGIQWNDPIIDCICLGIISFVSHIAELCLHSTRADGSDPGIGKKNNSGLELSIMILTL